MRHSPRSRPELWVCHLGTVAYRDALRLQADLRARRQAEELPDVLLLLEHPPTYTRGRRSSDAELPLGEPFYAARGIEIVPTDRGGRVTYHGPGQLVGYPIMRTADVLAHVRLLETAIVDTLIANGIHARSRAGEGADYTGVWVEGRKIASIGVHHSGGVTTHGFALNVENDLEPFSWITPCGLAGVEMTSVARELGPEREGAGALGPGETLADQMGASVAGHICWRAGRWPSTVGPDDLGLAPAGAGALTFAGGASR
jgi:lipoyl(octanoyl) transferase